MRKRRLVSSLDPLDYDLYLEDSRSLIKRRRMNKKDTKKRERLKAKESLHNEIFEVSKDLKKPKKQKINIEERYKKKWERMSQHADSFMSCVELSFLQRKKSTQKL